MTYELKRISTAGIAEAISKAELYRSLNEPEEAESICRDILAIEPQHQLALRLLGLALTDQFTGGRLGSLPRGGTESFSSSMIRYERLYYAGIAYGAAREGAAPRGAAAAYAAAALRAGSAVVWGGGKDPSGRERRCHPSLESLCTAAAEHIVFMGTGTRSVR